MDNHLFGRRRMLQLLGAIGVVTLVGCGDDENRPTVTDATSGSNPTNGTRGTTAAPGGATECATIPEETAGPFPGDGSNGPNVLSQDGVVREDIRSSFGSSNSVADGVPMRMNLTLVESGGECAALVGAAMYVWHCTREGGYSLYSDGVENENFLRGVQVSDDNGRVTFQSVFPGAYSGRWPHVHFEVYESLAAATSGGTPIATSQLAIPQETCQEVYVTSGYEASGPNLASSSLTSDMVFSDDGAAVQLASVKGTLTEGYTIALTVPVAAS